MAQDQDQPDRDRSRRLEAEEAVVLADAYRLSKSDRAALLELTELAGMRSLADELAWVTAHVFRKTTATILEDAGQTPRRIADQLVPATRTVQRRDRRATRARAAVRRSSTNYSDQPRRTRRRATRSFANRFGEGDLLLGHTLLEVKSERATPEDSLPRTLRQVLAYALADTDDELAIESVGV